MNDYGAAHRLTHHTAETSALLRAASPDDTAETAVALDTLAQRIQRHAALVAEADRVLEQLLTGTTRAFAETDGCRDDLDRAGVAATAAFDAATVAAQTAQAAEAGLGSLLDRLQTAQSALSS